MNSDTPYPNFDDLVPLKPTTTITDQSWMDRRVESLGGSIGLCAEWSRRWAEKHNIEYTKAFRLAVDYLESGKPLPLV